MAADPPGGPHGSGPPIPPRSTDTVAHLVERACGACESGHGPVLVRGATALALQAQAVEVASLAGGEWLLVAQGTGSQLEEALSLPQAWAATGLALEIGESGAVLLDAAHSVDTGRTLEGASVELTMASGRYDVRVLSDGRCEAWRLAPSKTRAPRKTAPRRRKS